jgi:MGT family glycosyltransferase
MSAEDRFEQCSAMSGRFLFTCWPFEAHIGPQLGIASALRNRGHEVAFYTAERARTPLEREGFLVFPFKRVGEPWVPVHTLEARTGGRRQSLRVVGAAMRYIVNTIPAQVDDLREIIDCWHPDVVVTESSMWGPMLILWEATPIPVAMSSILMGPVVPGEDAPPWGLGMAPPRTGYHRAAGRAVQRIIDLAVRPVQRRVDELRAEHGLAPIGCSINEFTGRLPLHLVGNVRDLDYNRRDLPASVHYVGPCSRHPGERARTADWLDALPSKYPWVHVTEGTCHYKRAFLLESAARGLAGAPCEVILTTGKNRQTDPSALSGAPNLHTRQWLSYTELLPRCAAMVTTGGPGGVVAAAKAGVPLVVVPTNWDKPDNARRVVEAGMGICLAPRKCTPRTLRVAVDEILTNPRYRANAQRIALRIADAPGPVGASDLLEGLLAPGQVDAPPARRVPAAALGVRNQRPQSTS